MRAKQWTWRQIAIDARAAIALKLVLFALWLAPDIIHDLMRVVPRGDQR